MVPFIGALLVMAAFGYVGSHEKVKVVEKQVVVYREACPDTILKTVYFHFYGGRPTVTLDTIPCVQHYLPNGQPAEEQP